MRDRLQICTFMWGQKYTPEHVHRLHRALQRNLTIPFDFVLITDQPDWWKTEAKGHFRVVELWDEMRDARLCGVRLRMFGRDMVNIIGQRFAWVDLDVVITGNVDHIFSREESFVALRPPRAPMPINGSLVIMNAGFFPFVYEQWSPAKYQHAGKVLGERHGIAGGTTSDEGWMWWTMPPDQVSSVTQADGVYYFRHDLKRGTVPLPKDACMVIMNGKPFDPSLPRWQKQCPWITTHWR